MKQAPALPRTAAKGYRVRVLAVDEPAAEVVRRVFGEPVL
jgi:hypothetical protein